MKKILQISIITLTLSFSLAETKLFAQTTYYWVGQSAPGTETKWSEPINWVVPNPNVVTAILNPLVTPSTPPTVLDDVIFNAASFDPTVNPNTEVVIDAAAFCKTMDWTGSGLYSPILSGDKDLTIAGSLTFVPEMSVPYKGKVKFQGTGIITSAGKIFLDEVTFSVGTWQLADNFSASDKVTVSSGTLEDKGFQITGISGKTFALSSGTKLILTRSGDAFPANFTANLDVNSTVEYAGGSAQIVKGLSGGGNSSYGNLTISGNSTKILSAASTVRNSLTINAGILADGGFQINASTPAASSLTIKAGATLNLGSATAATTFPGFITNVFETGSTVHYSASVFQTVKGFSAVGTGSYSNLILSGGATKHLGAATTISGNLSIETNTLLSDQIFTLTGNSTGTMTMASGARINLFAYSGLTAPNSPMPLFNTYDLDINSTVSYASNGAQGIRSIAGSGNNSYANLTLANSLTGSSTITKTLAGNILVRGNLNIGTRNILDVSINNRAIEIQGDWVNLGTFTPRTGTVTFNGATNATITTSSAFNNLTVNKTNATNSVFLLSNIIANNLTISNGILSAGYQNITLSGNWLSNTMGTFDAGTGTVTFNGATNVAITTSSSFNNLTISKSAANTVSLSSNITVGANLAISSGILSAGTRSISLAGNWTSSTGTFTAGTGTVTFNGTSPQTITANTASGNEFFNMVFNNTGGGVTLNSQVSVGKVITNNTPANNGNVTFINGIVNTVQNYPLDSKGEPDFSVAVGSILVFNDNTTASGASDVSHVNGYVRKTGDNDFWYPIGNGTYYRPSGTRSAGNSVFLTTDAKYILRNPAGAGTPSITSLQSPLASVSKYEYWDMIQVVNNSASRIMLSWRMPVSGGFEDINYFASENLWMLTVAGWEGKTASSGQWTNRLKGSLTVTDNNKSTYSGELISNSATPGPMRYWTIGSIFNALPVELISFKAKAVNGRVVLDWQSGKETNVSHYVVERSSADMNNFQAVKEMKAKGESTALVSYTATDANPVSGLSYYRLKIVDNDGTFEYSKIVAIQMTSAYALPAAVTLYPNPSDGRSINLIISNNDAPLSLQMFDMMGKPLSHVITESNNGLIAVQFNETLPTGMYVAVLTNTANQQKNQLRYIVK